MHLPIKDGVTLQRHLLLAGHIHKMIPADPITWIFNKASFQTSGNHSSCMSPSDLILMTFHRGAWGVILHLIYDSFVKQFQIISERFTFITGTQWNHWFENKKQNKKTTISSATRPSHRMEYDIILSINILQLFTCLHHCLLICQTYGMACLVGLLVFRFMVMKSDIAKIFCQNDDKKWAQSMNNQGTKEGDLTSWNYLWLQLILTLAWAALMVVFGIGRYVLWSSRLYVCNMLLTLHEVCELFSWMYSCKQHKIWISVMKKKLSFFDKVNIISVDVLAHFGASVSVDIMLINTKDQTNKYHTSTTRVNSLTPGWFEWKFR